MNDLSKLPRDLQDYIDGKVQSGEFADGLDVVATALAEMKHHEKKLGALKAEVAAGIAEDDAGIYSDLDIPAIIEIEQKKLEQR